MRLYHHLLGTINRGLGLIGQEKPKVTFCDEDTDDEDKTRDYDVQLRSVSTSHGTGMQGKKHLIH